jgi:hypothetical protein
MIVNLQKKLADAEARSGSLFDLDRDSAEDIVHAIVGNVSPNKARTIAQGVLRQLKAKEKPAG